jgi:O-antigen/teichoic acid export membrane protein
MILGNNAAIILNTKYYRWFLFFNLVLFFMMIGLYMILIPIYGITGAALATFLAIFINNTAKLILVYWKMNVFPFTIKTLYSFGIIILVFLMFYFWNFNYFPIVNILLKSVLITIFYMVFNYKLKISLEMNQILDKIISKYSNINN